MLEKVKNALRITVGNYDGELTNMIAAAFSDIGLTGVVTQANDPLVEQAVITYCRIHFGSPDDYDRLKRSYDEQKAQLITASGYGLRGDCNG